MILGRLVGLIENYRVRARDIFIYIYLLCDVHGGI